MPAVENPRCVRACRNACPTREDVCPRVEIFFPAWERWERPACQRLLTASWTGACEAVEDITGTGGALAIEVTARDTYPGLGAAGTQLANRSGGAIGVDRTCPSGVQCGGAGVGRGVSWKSSVRPRHARTVGASNPVAAFARHTYRSDGRLSTDGMVNDWIARTAHCSRLVDRRKV